MDEQVDDRARARLRSVSRALTGKAPFRLEIGLAVVKINRPHFSVMDLSALLPTDGVGQSHNISRNLQSFVDAGFLQQSEPGAPYHLVPHPFWAFVEATWEECRRGVSEPAEDDPVGG